MLNKFLGASVLMSGVEAMLPGTGGSRKEVMTTRTVSGLPSTHQVSEENSFVLLLNEDREYRRINLTSFKLILRYF